jgi:multiple sugar transport system permease protein
VSTLAERAPARRAAVPVARSKIGDSETWLGRLLLGPAILYIVLVVGVPFVLALFYSLTNVTVTGRHMEFIGLANFREAIHNPTFRRALGNTFLFALASQGLVIILASTLGIALQQNFRGKWLVRLLILLPWVAPISLGSIGWLWIFDPVYSVINWTLRSLHLLGPGQWPVWLGEPALAKSSVILVQVWRTLPLATVILLGGLSSIPQDLHDAAEVDGAGFFRHLFQITLPLVLPIQLVAILFGFVFAFTDMIVIWVLTRGGPYETTHVLASEAFYTGIDGGNLAGGAAIALFLFPVLAAAAILLLRLARSSEVI